MKKKSMHRRDFLRTSGAFASATMLATPSLRAEANERIRIGVIGTGKWSQHRTREFGKKRQHAEIVAVCDVDTNRRLAAKARAEKLYAKESKSGAWKGCTAHADYRDLLADDSIDAVIITTPRPLARTHHPGCRGGRQGRLLREAPHSHRP